MLRITAGSLKGRKLRFESSNNQTRPTLSFVREAIFSSLNSLVDGANFLDLFAGSGIMSFEAISRGASFAECIEKNRHLCNQINSNKSNFLLGDSLNVLNLDSERYLKKFAKKDFFDIVYLDPPYDSRMYELCLNLILDNSILKQNAVIIMESSFRDDELSQIFLKLKTNHQSLNIFKQKNYGQTKLTYYNFE